MKKTITFLFAISLTLCIFNSVEAAVLNFDDITTEEYFHFTNYGGFTWDAKFAVASDSFYATYGNTYGSPSGEYAASNDGALSVSVTSPTDFNFCGAYFTGWAVDDEYWEQDEESTATSITVIGYNNSTFVGSETMSLSTNQYDWLATNFVGVDEIVFQTSGTPPDEPYWLMDNFTYNEPCTKPIPEPASILLLGLGSLGILGLRRYKK